MTATNAKEFIPAEGAQLQQPVQRVRQVVPTGMSGFTIPVRLRWIAMAVLIAAGCAIGLSWLMDLKPSSVLTAQQLNAAIIKSHLEVERHTPNVSSEVDNLNSLSNNDDSVRLEKNVSQKTTEPDTTTSSVVGERSVWSPGDLPQNPTKEFMTWHRWTQEGRYSSARYALKRHLISKPEDIDAWSLLADCERRAGRWRAAIHNYRKVVALSTGPRRWQTMFTAGDLAQDNSDDLAAAVIFRQYLREREADASLRAEGLVRLAHSYRNIGLVEESRDLQRQIVKNFSSSTLSARSKKMLSELTQHLSK